MHDPAARWRVGVSTGVAARAGYAPERALEYARAHRFEMLQVYLTAGHAASVEGIEKLAKAALAAGIELLVHAPFNLGCPELAAPRWLEAASRLLGYQDRRTVVSHVDSREPLAAAMAGIEKLREAGLLPAPENAHHADSVDAAAAGWRFFTDVLRAASHTGPVSVTLDIPRLFDRPNHLRDRWQQCLAELRDLALERDLEVLLHLIDCSCEDQSDRRSWCPIGKGLLPWQEILALLGPQLRVTGAILEYEDPDTPLESRERLLSWAGVATGGP